MTSRHIDIGKRGHGPCRVLFHADIDQNGRPLEPEAPLLRTVKTHILWEKNRQAMKAIDRDYQRGGFTANMRHAR